MKVILLGDTGQLGQAFINLNADNTFECYSFNRSNFDIQHLENFFRRADSIGADFLINMIAYTDVNRAEEQNEQCALVNHHFPKRLSKFCKQRNIQLIHISTDYVFDGTNTEPYNEIDKPNPLSEYGFSKYLGENSILNSGCTGYIIRTSGLFSQYRTNFLKNMIDLLATKKKVHVVSDQFFNPTYAKDLAILTAKIINHRSSNEKVELLHYSGDCPTSWYLFTKMIKDILIKKEIFKDNQLSEIQSISLNNFESMAKRPLYSILDNAKSKKRFQHNSSNWKLGLSESIKMLQFDNFFDKYKDRFS